MRTATLLRATAVLAFVQFCAHAARFVSYVPQHGPDESGVVEAMKSHSFIFSGATRSYWDFYFGYGLMAAFNCLIEFVLFWQLASIAKSSAAVIKPVAGLFLVANVGYAILVLIYFFPLPAYFDIAIAILLGGVLFSASRGTEKNGGQAPAGGEPRMQTVKRLSKSDRSPE
jgi:hypothetical protein